MTVGELRRALEGVSDTREVCVYDDGCYVSVESAQTREIPPLTSMSTQDKQVVLVLEHD